MKVIINWILTFIFAILIVFECWQLFDQGNINATNIIILVVAFILTFLFSTLAKVAAKK